MEASKKWSLGLILFGFACLGLFVLLSSQSTSSSNQGVEVGVVEVFQGDVFIHGSQPGSREKIQGRRWIFKSDSLETKENAEASIDFPSNYRIKVAPQSLLYFDHNQETSQILIQRGELFVVNYGIEGSLFISKDGQEFNADDYGRTPSLRGGKFNLADFPPGSQTQKASRLKKTPGENPVAKKSQNRLTQKIIQEVLKNSKNHFYKCYSQLLQKTPGVGGQASIAFGILATGRVYQPEISSSSLQDAQFKKCLVSVIERVEFPSFSGSTVSTVFPIRFE